MQANSSIFTPQQISYWMQQALSQAEKGATQDEIPVGCVFVGKLFDKYHAVAASHNLTNLYKNASRHCEINCLRKLEQTHSKEEIRQLVLFVTVEPCIMCTFALNLSGIKLCYFGQFNDKFGGCGSLRKDNLFEIQGGIMEKESLKIIKRFYQRGNQRIPEEMRNRSRKKVKQNEELQK